MHRFFLFLITAFLAAGSLSAQNIALNEIVASNNTIIADEDGDYEDWIEIVNFGEEPVNLVGYGLSDDYDEPFRWALPEIHLQPGSHLLIWASSKDRRIFGAPLHTNFAISASGEEILLTRPDGTRIDELQPTEIPTDMSIGRQPDGIGDWVYFSEPTPGAANTTQSISGLLDEPEFSHLPGFHTSDFDLEITHSEEGVTIYYTLDGSKPTTNSPIYSGPISIYNRSGEPNDLSLIPTNHIPNNYSGGRRTSKPPRDLVKKGTVVRTLAVKTGYLSRESRGSYFVFPGGSNVHSLPVISIATDRDNLFGHEQGIYVPGAHYIEGKEETGNYFERGIEWEREASIEFFDENGHIGFDQNVGLRIHGGHSRRFPHKTLRVYARSEYGESRIKYPVFLDQDYDEYNRLLLRNSGNDQGFTMLRDAVAHKLVKHLNFDTSAYRPAIVYINGEYWGLHNIRERYDRHYLERVYGIDPDNIDLLTGRWDIVEGDNTEYRDMLGFINFHDLSQEHRFEQVKTMIDIDNFLDYYSAQVYYVNTDWPHANIDFWRSRVPYNPELPAGHDGRWRWLFYDIDFTFYMTEPPSFNMLAWVTGETGYLGMEWPNLILRNLLENQSFRDDFINRMADHLNTTFLPEHAMEVVDEAVAVIEPEMSDYSVRWNYPLGITDWRQTTQQIYNFIERRPQHLRQNIVNHFNLASARELTINSSHTERSLITVNTIRLTPDTPGVSHSPFPWKGTYFSGVPITLSAEPYEDVDFLYWLINDTPVYQSAIVLDPDTVTTATAVFDGNQLSDIDPHPLAAGAYFFHEWDEDAPTGSFPESMAFVFMNGIEPGLDALIAGLTFGDYNLDSRTRIVGLGEDGFAFINTTNPEGNPGYPGTRLGGAILALDTRGIEGAAVAFEAGTVLPNSRVYNLRLQYRTGSEGEFLDLLDDEGNPVEYHRSSEEGHTEFIGPVALPDEAIGHERIELLWRYYHTGELADEESGQRTMINLSFIHVAESEDEHIPEAHVLTNNPYEFSFWPADASAGSSPPSMVFTYMNQTDPGLDAEILGYTSGAFNLDSRTRIAGLDHDGFAFINTANLQGNPGYPGGRLGGALLALNTEGQGSVTVEWAGGTVQANSRIYNLRLQYRTDVNEPFRDVLEENGNPVEYQRNVADNHLQTLGPVTLPEDTDDQPYVQLFWRYYFTGEHEDEDIGQRSMLNISNIRVHSFALLGSEPGMPSEFRLYQNYPNPFYPYSTIRYDLPRDQHVRIELFSIAGSRVAILEDHIARAGRHSVVVDASGLASGVYLYRFVSEEFSETGKLSVIK